MRAENVCHTQHSALLVLDGPLFADIIRNPEEDDHVVMGCVFARVEAPDYGEAPALVNVETRLLQLRLKLGKREALARHAVCIELKVCP